MPVLQRQAKVWWKGEEKEMLHQKEMRVSNQSLHTACITYSVQYLVEYSRCVHITTGVTLTRDNKGGQGRQISSPAEPQACEPPQQRISARAFAQVRKRNADNNLLL